MGMEGLKLRLVTKERSPEEEARYYALTKVSKLKLRIKAILDEFQKHLVVHDKDNFKNETFMFMSRLNRDIKSFIEEYVQDFQSAQNIPDEIDKSDRIRFIQNKLHSSFNHFETTLLHNFLAQWDGEQKQLAA